MPWLETLLAGEKLERANQFFSELLPVESPSKSVLRVFFGQSDACLVTTNSFAVACELNPQLNRDLEILAVSPPVIPAFFFFRPGCRAETRALLEPALLDLHTKPAGEQVLTVFQCVRMEKQPLSAFDPTRRLLLEYHRLQDSPSLNRSSASLSPPQALLSP
jgi:ABC-type phosphate/phosphonate transport system substrate-binding protein